MIGATTGSSFRGISSCGACMHACESCRDAQQAEAWQLHNVASSWAAYVHVVRAASVIVRGGVVDVAALRRTRKKWTLLSYY